MAEALGNVGGKADVGGGETVLVVDVVIVNTTDRGHLAGLVATVVANELSHGPRLIERGFVLPEGPEVPYDQVHQVRLAVPEVVEQLALFIGSQEV